MDTTTSVVATGIVVTAGTWTSGKELSFKTFVGFGVMTVILTVMQSANQRFAEQFATLILVAACFYYAVPIAKSLGYGKGK